MWERLGQPFMSLPVLLGWAAALAALGIAALPQRSAAS